MMTKVLFWTSRGSSAPSRNHQHLCSPRSRLTGITDAMLAGQRINLDAVEAFIEQADLVIAHNAGFDRPFCERLA